MGTCAAMPARTPTRNSPAGAGSDAAPGLEQWEQTWAMWAHIGALIATIPSGFVLQFLVPLVIWLSQRDRSGFVADHAREALNFHLSLLIWWVIGGLLVFACGLGVLVLMAIPVVMIVAGILAAIAASQGRYYRYPVTFRLV